MTSRHRTRHPQRCESRCPSQVPAAYLYREQSCEWLAIRIADSGPGIPPDLLATVFEPFITTKETGTGLGLSIVDSVVKDMGGVRSVDADPELKGARFTIWLKLE